MIIQKGIYPEGKKKCLIFSYDDDMADNAMIIDLFRKYGIRGTFNFNGSGLLEDGAEQKERPQLYKSQLPAIDDEFEVACHGYVHPPYGYMDAAQCADDVIRDRRTLEAILHHPVRGLALPSGVYSKETLQILRACGIAYCRTIECTGGFELPTDFMEWHPTAKHDDFDKLFAAGEAYLKGSWRLNNYLSCMLIYGHSYEMAADARRQKLEEFLQMMAGREDIWYATCMELYSYLSALDQLIMTVDGTCVINPTLTDVWVRANGEAVCIPAGQTKRFD
ncbi:MAG: hypothetical protein E7541_06385 [Ruminococcaceae bacterium]|nr:hypothetical protein [Oscillospiraceae bacterium]